MTVRTLIIALALLATLPANASAHDGVVVVGSGGTTGIDVFDLENTDEGEAVVDRGLRRILPEALGPQILNDVKILPDGSHLIAGGDSVGLIVTDSAGAEILSLTRQSAFGAVASASVGAYFSGAEPSRVIIGSDTVSAVFARQISSERLLFFDSTRLGESRGEHAEVAVLPGNAIAIAANYPANGQSSLDILTIDGNGTTRVRYSNGDNLSHPPETTLDPIFDDFRDVHGFGPDTPRDLLVVTRTKVFRLTADGTRTWTVDLGTIGIGGEFASGVVLPSGRIAVATFEPGRWVDPHPNHRIAWLESDGTFTGILSGPLDTAPVSIDALEGHGGTGTTGFTAGLEQLSLGDSGELELGQPIYINGTTFSLGSRISSSVTVSYPGENAVSLRRLRLVAAPAQQSCEGLDVPVVEFARDEGVTILSQEAYPLNGALSVDSVFDFGPWCAWVEVSDTTGRVFRLGDYATFAVVEQGGDAGGEPIPGTTLGFGGPDADAGTDAGVDAGEAPGTGEDGGCGCTSAPAVDPSFVALLAILFGWRRRRR